MASGVADNDRGVRGLTAAALLRVFFDGSARGVSREPTDLQVSVSRAVVGRGLRGAVRLRWHRRPKVNTPFVLVSG